MSRLDNFHDALARHAGDADAAIAATMGDGPTTAVPFNLAGHLKDEVTGEGARARQGAIDKELGQPPHLEDVDPKSLKAMQGSVTREGVKYYLGRQFEETGQTYANQDQVGNQHPFVYTRDRDGANLLMSGHHRATAALMKGQPLRARRAYGP